MSTIEENNWICQCGHGKDKHADRRGIIDTSPCYTCLGFYIKDRDENIPWEKVHKMCEDFKLDNLRYLEQEYERLSKRIQ